jgi:zinc D-Ala-D-Ala carboxypeptidase
MTHLSTHFSLAEMTVTSTGLANQPNAVELSNLQYTTLQMERVRLLLNSVPVIVHSAFRSLAVNRRVGGSETSAHVRGLAVDFTAPKYGSPRLIVETLSKSKVPFDQLILEMPNAGNNYNGAWVHIGFVRTGTPRRQVLTAYKLNGRTTYVSGIVSPATLAKLLKG